MKNKYDKERDSQTIKCWREAGYSERQIKDAIEAGVLDCKYPPVRFNHKRADVQKTQLKTAGAIAQALQPIPPQNYQESSAPSVPEKKRKELDINSDTELSGEEFKAMSVTQAIHYYLPKILKAKPDFLTYYHINLDPDFVTAKLAIFGENAEQTFKRSLRYICQVFQGRYGGPQWRRQQFGDQPLEIDLFIRRMKKDFGL